MFPLFVYRTYYWLHAYLAHALAHALALLRSSAAPPYPTPAPAISCAWLTQVLRAQGLISASARVTHVDMGVFEVAGFEGAMKKVKVEYKEEGTNKEISGPPSFVLKTSRDSIMARHSIITGGNNREALFYAHPYARQINTPKTIYAYSSRFLGEHLVLLEDLTIRPGYTKVGNIFGNQIWGITQPTTKDPVETITKMYLDAAAFHAKFWNDQNLLEQSWLRESQWYKGKNRHQWELSMEKGRSSWREVKEMIKTKKFKFEFSPKLAAIIEKSFAKASWANLQAHLQNPSIPFTFCHGDYHAGNMIIVENQLLLVDWSQCGPWEPTTDLAQTVISDVKPELFQKHTKEWLRVYWERLIQLGISEKEYPFQLCWDSFCRGGAERWIWLFTIMVVLPGVPEELTHYFHNQLLSFIESHGDQEYYVLKPMVIMW